MVNYGITSPKQVDKINLITAQGKVKEKETYFLEEGRRLFKIGPINSDVKQALILSISQLRRNRKP